ncbi:MAG: thioesterase [Gracilibacteraceae bacterium]|jgi:predicted thioesterase|nr:thioesterase [Gracilibacteraceae bacterium]
MQLERKGRAETRVTEANTAAALGSGSLPVFATPALVALMEQAAVNALALAAGETSVGVSVEIRHTAASGVGRLVRAEAEVTEEKGRRLVFRVSAADENGPVGAGRHERVIVNSAAFLAKTRAGAGE